MQGNAQPQGYMVLARAVVADGNDVLLLDLGGVGAEGLKPGLGGSQGGDAHPADDVGQLHAGTGQGRRELGFGVHAGQAVDGGAGGTDIAVNLGFAPAQ